MKRCPQCHRVETDETLKFCRTDGATLVSEPADFSESRAVDSSEVHTSILPHNTQANVNRATGPTMTLPQASTGPTHELTKPRSRKALLIAIAAVIITGFVIGGVFIARKLSPSGSRQTIESVAVLPFENKSGNADSEYLSDGLAESLIYRLSQLPNLKVSSTSSVIRYKGKDTDVAQIAKELDVDAVMSGRVSQRGEDLTISVELVDARTRKIIWAEQYARKMSDLLATQREIAAAVTQKLQLKLSGNEASLTKQYTNNNEAYQLYLKGRFYWNKRTSAGMKTAIEHFKAASEKDPNFALAYVGMADSYLVGLYNTRGQEKEAIPMAKAYAARAMEIDPSLAEVHATLGLVNHYQWNWAEAVKYFKQSIAINPKYPSARHWYSRTLRQQGKHDEGLDQIMQAQQLDSLSLAISNNVAESLLLKGDVAGAIKESQRTLEIGPTWVAYRTLAHCYLRMGQKEEAVAQARKAVELLDRSPVALKVLGYVQASAGNRTEALAIVREIENEFAKGNADGRDVAIVYAGLGENDKAFEWLEKDFQNRNSSLAELQLEFPFVPLRGDPRFKDLLKRMNLSE